MKKLYSNYITFIIGEGISKGVVFVLLSFYTTYFSKVEFGTLALFWAIVPIFSIFFDFAQRSYIKNRTVYNQNKGLEALLRVAVFSSFMILILSAIFFVAKKFNLYLINNQFDSYIIICAYLFTLIELALSYLQISGKFLSYNVAYIAKNSLPYIITFLVVIFGDNGQTPFTSVIFPKIQAVVLVIIFIALYSLLVLKNKSFEIKSIFSNIYAKSLISLKFSFPIIPGILSALLLSFADRFIINYVLDEARVSEYAVAYIISSIFMALFMATNKVWQKFILKNLKSQDLKTISIKGRRYFLFIVIAGCFLVIFRDTLLSIISNDSYMSTSHLIPPITLGMFFYFLFTMYSNIPFFYRDTLLMSAPAIFAAIINIILNFIYIPKYGIIAAAYTTAISYFFQFLIIYFICTKKYNIDILFNASKK